MQHFRHSKSELAPAIKTPVRIKTSSAELAPTELLRRQVEIAKDCLVPVDLNRARGTCVDERKRTSLLNGSSDLSPRPSVPGGPDLYLLAISELIDSFGPNDNSSAEERLKTSKQKLNDAGLLSGGHVGCKFNEGWLDWLAVIANNPDYIMSFTRQTKAGNFVPAATIQVIQNAKLIFASRRYSEWHGDALVNVLGDEAGAAIEKLAPVEHGAKLVVRTETPNQTIDQNELYDRSVIGKGVYDMDDWYADTLEQIAASGPDAVQQKIKAEHAREAILTALVMVVPNPDLYATAI